MGNLYNIAGHEAKVLTYFRLGLASSEGVTKRCSLRSQIVIHRRWYFIKNLIACFLEKWTLNLFCLRLGTEFRRSGSPPKINHW